MTTTREYKCEICGTTTENPVHWFIIECADLTLSVHKWSTEGADRDSARHFCGEMAFLEAGVASASVVAVEDVEAYSIEWSALKDLFELFPHLGSRFYRSLAVGLSRRLREQLLSRPAATQ